MMTLYDNAFSPFARKVRMVLEQKGLEAVYVDGLRRENHSLLQSANGRVEVPALMDGDLTVVNSSDIVAYLDHRYPENPVLPGEPAARARARAWERTADDTIDPILVDISYWLWAERPDEMPDGLLAAARADMDQVYSALESELGDDGFVCGALTVADFALFPHLMSVKAMGVPIDRDVYPRLSGWLKRMLALDICQADLARTRDYVKNLEDQDGERVKIFWRGDRVEWLLARGFHDWFIKEIEEDRVLWPGLGLPPQATG
jgi:glutathione S-transferase